MSFNIVDLVKSSLGNQIQEQLASALGEDSGKVGGALKTAIPFILGAVANKGSDEKGAGDLLSMFTKMASGSQAGGGLADMLSGNNQAATQTQGTEILESLLGGGNKVSSMLDIFGKVTGMGGKSSGGILKLLSPMIMSVVGSYVKKQGLGASGLATLLLSQKGLISKLLPADLSGQLGISSGGGSGKSASCSMSGTADSAACAVKGAGASATAAATGAAKSSGGFLSKILPLLLLLGALFFALRSCGGGDVPTVDMPNVKMPNVVEGTKGALGGVADMGSKMVDTAKDTAGGVVGGVADMGSKMADTAKDAAGGVVGGVADMGSKMADTAKDAAGGVVGGVADMGAKMVDKAGEVTTGAVDAVGGTIKRMVEDISISLPGDIQIESSPGSFTDKFVTYLESDSAVDASKLSAFAFDKVNFQTGSAVLTQDSARQVNNFAKVLKAYPNVKIQLEGHTDNTGNAAANKSLSQKRADSVKAAIAAQNVNPDRVVAMGFGDEKPVADNATDAGRAQNRRVSVAVTAK